MVNVLLAGETVSQVYEQGKVFNLIVRAKDNVRDEMDKIRDLMIDTPGEYIQTKNLGNAIALYAYESDIVGLLLSATEPFSLYPPNITCMANREVIGIVTQIDREDANPDRAERWLRLSGCKKVFRISSVTGEGIDELRDYLL